MVVLACWVAFSPCWPWYTTERERKDIDDLMTFEGALHTWREVGGDRR